MPLPGFGGGGGDDAATSLIAVYARPRPPRRGAARLGAPPPAAGAAPPVLWELGPLRPVATSTPVNSCSSGDWGWPTTGGDDQWAVPLLQTEPGYRLTLEDGAAVLLEGPGVPLLPPPGGRTVLPVAASPRRPAPGRAAVPGAAPAVGPRPAATPLAWPIARSPRRMAAGRAAVGPLTRELPPPIGIPWRGLRVASPRRMAAGRVWRPAVQEAAGSQAQTPLRAALRPSASPRRPAPGRAAITPWAPAASTQAQTPLVGLIRPASSPRHRRGGSLWYPPQPRSTSGQAQTPILWILRPAARPGDAIARSPRGSARPARAPRVPDQPPARRPWAAASRRGDDRARRRPGATWAAANPRLPYDGPDLWYNIYGCVPGTQAEIPYFGSPLFVTQDTSWTTPFDLAPGPNSFAVRAGDAFGEEWNLDCEVTIVLGPEGQDWTDLPRPPAGLRALPTAGGAIRVEWYHAGDPRVPARAPTAFNVYIGAGSAVDYSSPVAVVPYAAGYFGTFRADVPAQALPGGRGRLLTESGAGLLLESGAGLLGEAGDTGDAYAVGVRATNAAGEEPNVLGVPVVAAAAFPAAVADLMGSAII